MPAKPDDAQLLEWELIVPSREDVDRVAANVVAGGAAVDQGSRGALMRDPWGTAVRVLTD